ncbi:MAG TPA: N-acetylglucosamine-6-phosphate deacetylase [Treponema sp.]|nr:MAG: N-acetylglucosamine-6-phosphate deacetylase [Treponema sp. GWA1_62_8]OHE64936.1 MAG: N-acetylglucosamine-6-phosphate deacetylase [Treponema sp. GWC1_61_84]OHE75739.1 MAG: N-acetylglucosamine-6-phosphate deacetylase [Treponema sp. RIFOXYC1_FULL_61_9]HCM28116.1 N-acetylglucosamine-6-phosphate deacetylase [Treponema sp.]
MGSICFHNGTVLTGFSAMEKCAVLVEGGLISDVFSEKRFEGKRFSSDFRIVDVGGSYIAPGLVDTHIHGFGGFGTDDASTESVVEMSRLLAGYGVTAFNPTLYPAEPKALLEVVRKVSAAIGKESGARIMGLHLEGPFLSAARLGVQKSDTLSPVDINFMDALVEASGGRIVNMTVAPELKGMRELALYCIKKGIVLQAGHTDANYDNMVEGMQVGILHATHLFNAMSKLDHRNPNAVGAVLIHPEMSCEIIADGFHVHPDLMKLIRRDKPIDKIVLVTDSLKPTEQAVGPLFANGEEVVLHDGVFHRKIDDVIAGSCLTMMRGVRNLVSYGFSVEDAVKTASSNPARVMRFSRKGTIVPGNDADLVVFDRDFRPLAVVVAGELKLNEF